jgi:hypothetical protein
MVSRPVSEELNRQLTLGQTNTSPWFDMDLKSGYIEQVFALMENRKSTRLMGLSS